MTILDALLKISNEIEAQQTGLPYSTPYGPGAASPYVDYDNQIMSGNGSTSPDFENPGAEPRAWKYDATEGDMIQEWGEDHGIKPNGMEKIEVEKRCKKCHGDGCKVCNFIGFVKEKIKTTKSNPRVDGRILDQLRYNGPAWPHNRDFNNVREEPQTWQQMMNDKQFLGRPSMF